MRHTPHRTVTARSHIHTGSRLLLPSGPFAHALTPAARGRFSWGNP